MVVVVGVDTDIGDEGGEYIVPAAPGVAVVVVVPIPGCERDLAPFNSFDPFPSFELDEPKKLERRCTFLVEEELVATE